MFDIINKNEDTEKWKIDIVEWLVDNCKSDFPSEKITVPCSDSNQDWILEVDVSKEYLVGSKMVIDVHRKGRWVKNQYHKGVDLENVPFISLVFKDSVKRVHSTFKDYMMYRIWGDLKLNFDDDDIPFYFICGTQDIRMFNTDILNSKGERLDKEIVEGVN